jgi:hypothetical protein
MYVHCDDVGMPALHHAQGVFAIAGSADNHDIGIGFENMNKKLAYHG